MKHILVKTTDGSHTIYVPELKEHYHSIHGAIQESEHIFKKSGYDFCKADPVRILEIGFGTGLNALKTALCSLNDRKQIIYTTVEKFPLGNDITEQLNYSRYFGEAGKEIFDKIHTAEWGSPVEIFKNFSLHKIHDDLITMDIPGSFDLIYFDAFGPDKQPEMWSRQIIEKISAATASGGIFVTYSVKGELKRNLKASGFRIELLQGPPGKRQMLRGVKI